MMFSRTAYDGVAVCELWPGGANQRNVCLLTLQVIGAVVHNENNEPALRVDDRCHCQIAHNRSHNLIDMLQFRIKNFQQQ